MSETTICTPPGPCNVYLNQKLM